LMMRAGLPGRAEPTGVHDPRIIREMLRDHISIRELVAEPTDGQLQVIAVDLGGCIEAETIAVVLREVHPPVLIEEVLDLDLPPRRTDSPVCLLAALEVDAAFVGVAVELVEDVVLAASVVVDDVDDHGEADTMRRVDEMSKSRRRSVRRLGR